MILHLSRLFTDSIGRLLFVMALLVFASGASNVVNAEFVPLFYQNLRDLEKYYETENLADAAQEMRQDAARFDLDIYERPEVDKSTPPFSVLHLPVAKIAPDFSERSYASVLQSKSTLPGYAQKYVAILAVYRELSIDEVAAIFESEIRILEKLFAGPDRQVFGGYMVKGRASDLVELQERDYFAWLGEYSADLKRQADLGASSINQYGITLHKRLFEDSYFSDLESHQAVVRNKSERSGRIGVNCNWEIAKKLCELDWVRSIYPVEYDISW